jgi:dihydrodipicolinate synthase/N-acetylneuraminate lyase
MNPEKSGPSGGGLPPVKPGRAIVGMSAVLLPFDLEGKPDWAGLERLVHRTFEAGLTPALNMDTGYGPLLTHAERQEGLKIGAELAKGRKFVAGACVPDRPGDPFQPEAYHQEIAAIDRAGGVPVIMQSHGLTGLRGRELVEAYRGLGTHCPRGFIAFELGKQFSSAGEIYSLDVYRELLTLPKCLGAKHSSLDRMREWDRLALRDCFRPDFLVLTGNDLAIDMVMYGSDYLLGLSAFHPEAFALRDRFWRERNPHFFALNDWLQYLGFLTFRDPVPAYKHSAAQFLHLRGLVGHPGVHPACPKRPGTDLDLLRPILEKLEEMMTCCDPR